MLITNRDALIRAATAAILTGAPFESLFDAVHRHAAEEAAAKIVGIDDMRDKLRSRTTGPPTIIPSPGYINTPR